MTLRLVVTTAAQAVVLILFAGNAFSQTYPTKPIRLIVSYGPGGGSDVTGRILAHHLTERIGQQVVVENRLGAGGSIGTEVVVRSAPDGYTLLLGSPSEIAINPVLYTRLPYDPMKDLAPVAIFASTPLVLVVHPSLPVKSVKDLVALGKARPAQLNYGSAGSGSITHLAPAIFASVTGISVVHVPYKGLGPAITDLVGGQIHMICFGLPAVLPLVQARRLKPLAVTTVERAKALPEVPTLAEAGVKDYAVTHWYGLFVPAATSREIIQRLHGEIAQTLRSPETLASIAKQGADPGNMTHERFVAFVNSEAVKWAKAVKDSGARAD
jgi:tripartite-type tricarboxylate transporter receptor subunit TctC